MLLKIIKFSRYWCLGLLTEQRRVTGWRWAGLVSHCDLRNGRPKAQGKANLLCPPQSDTIYSWHRGRGGEKEKNDTFKGEASLLRVLAVVWRQGKKVTSCPNPKDLFPSSLLVLAWSDLSSCHRKSDPGGAVRSFNVPYLTERPFLVLWQMNILPALSVWVTIPDGHSPYVFTSDWHS